MLLGAGPAPSQAHGDLPAAVQALLLRAERTLATAHPADDAARHRFVLAWLRLARPERARALLAEAAEPTTDTGAVWQAIALASYARATGDRELAQTMRPALERRLARAADRPIAPTARYADRALLQHARLCLSLLVPAPEAAHTLRRAAMLDLLALEADCWQPGRAHFRPVVRAGRVLAPMAAEPDLLRPLEAGLLLATRGRLHRHLTGTLRAAHSGDARRWRGSGDLDPALHVHAAVELRDADELQAGFDAVVAAPVDSSVELCGAQLARRVDAALLAMTGVRLAAGVGHGERFVRVMPWLPTGTDAARFDVLLVQGHRLSLCVRRAPDGSIDVELSSADATPTPVVVGDQHEQHVGEVPGAGVFRCRLGAR